MKRENFLLTILFAGLVFSSCEKLLEPAYDNSLSDEMVWSNPIYAEGVLLRAYVNMPELYDFTSDLATSDALSNEKGDDANRIAGGEWSSQYNPISSWDDVYESIFYINHFLENMDSVDWSYRSDITDALHAKRLRGEAFGLRAWYQMQLLQGYSGNAGSELLGYPIVTKVLEGEDFRIPRGSFQDCLTSIFADCDSAIALLPEIYEDSKDTEVDNALGEKFVNRINGRAVKAIKARVALYAASPAYNPENNLSIWENAMEISGDFIQDFGGVGDLPSDGIDYYLRSSASAQEREDELLWYTTLSDSYSMEEENFPPSFFGDGKVNPSQELVDAFPASDGYPIDQSSVYDPQNPYANRDDRLAAYVIYNGSTFKGNQVFTHTGDLVDGINAQNTSTRTGYYLRKFMNESVLLDPLSSSKHFYAYLRTTEVFLNFAEAANEFGGPSYEYNGFSALDVMYELRERADINNHDYLDGLDQAGLREAIQNERRIELCFEGHRFWDIRRWKLEDAMNKSVSGIYISPDSIFSANFQVVAERLFQPHMLYGPIPYDEILKMDIKQNEGW